MGDFKMGSKTVLSQSGTNDPTWGANAPPGMVIEEFMSPCDGSSITVQSGTYTVENVTAKQELTNTFAAVNGSTIDYTPPTGTQTVIYTFSFQSAWPDNHSIASYKLFLDNDSGTLTEVTNARFGDGGQFLEHIQTFIWAFHIGGSDNDATGRRDTWTSARTIQLQANDYASTNERFLHSTSYFDTSNTDTFHQPVIGIKALA